MAQNKILLSIPDNLFTNCEILRNNNFDKNIQETIINILKKHFSTNYTQPQPLKHILVSTTTKKSVPVPTTVPVPTINQDISHEQSCYNDGIIKLDNDNDNDNQIEEDLFNLSDFPVDTEYETPIQDIIIAKYAGLKSNKSLSDDESNLKICDWLLGEFKPLRKDFPLDELSDTISATNYTENKVFLEIQDIITRNGYTQSLSTSFWDLFYAPRKFVQDVKNNYNIDIKISNED